MPQPLDLIVAILACYRLSQFIALDEGPGLIFKRLREWPLQFQNRRGADSLTDLLECAYCQGVWFAGALAIVVTPRNAFADWLIASLAIAGGQAFLQAVGDRQNVQPDG